MTFRSPVEKTNSLTLGSVMSKLAAWMLNSQPLVEAAKAFIVSRIVVLGTAYAFFYAHYLLGNAALPPAPAGYLEYGQGPLNWHPFNLLFYYDSVHYMSIAQYGYSSVLPLNNPTYFGHETTYLASFFPLYPLLIRLMGTSIGAGIFIANFSFLAALVAIYLIGGKRAAWFTAFSPITIVFSSVYAESLLLALSAWAMLFAQRRRFLLCALLAGLAALTRPAGWALIAGLFLFFALKKDWRVAFLSGIVASLLGLIYPLFLWVKFGDPLLFSHATATIYHRTLSFPLCGVINDVKNLFLSGLNAVIIINLLGLILIVYSLSNPWWPYGLAYSLLILSVSGTHPQAAAVVSMLRYAGACAPVYLVPQKSKFFIACWAAFAMVYALFVAHKWFVV